MGDLDTSFSGDGKADFGLGTESWAAAIAPGPSGKLLVAAVMKNQDGPMGEPGDYDIVVFQLNLNGTLDLSFRPDGTGSVQSLVGPGDQFATSMAVAADGFIYVGGYGAPDTPTADNTSDALIIAINSAGTSATTFKYDLNGQTEVGNAIAIQIRNGDERVILGGIQYAGNPNNSDFALIRVFGRNSASGSLGDVDTSFGVSGRAVVDMGGPQGDHLRSLVLLSTGQIIASGFRSLTPSTSEGAVAGFTPNGTLDGIFGNNGRYIPNFGGVTQEKLYASGVNPRTEDLYFVGSCENGFVVVRTDFAGGAPTLRVAGSTGDVAKAMVMEPDTMKPIITGNSAGNFKALRVLR